MSGPLQGIRVVELGALGPAPFGSSVLADFGADVIRIDRTQATDLGFAVEPKYDVYNRNKRSLALDLKQPESIETVLKLVEKADVVVEGFRPGVTERLGLGPDTCLARNARVVYARMTGWGQRGPMSQVVGHDINYLGLTGALHSIGEKDKPPVAPLNLVADLGGGAMYMVSGILAAIIEANKSGKGQVIDVAMVDAVVNLMTAFFAYRQAGMWSLERESNFVDGGAPFYRTYETLDGKYMAVGAIEGRFYRDLLKGLGLAGDALPAQNDQSAWPEMRERFAGIFKTKTRDQWVEVMTDLNACCTPVLDMDEAIEDSHMNSRKSFSDFDGITHPSPAPRFSRTPGALRYPPPSPGEHSAEILRDWGIE